MLFLKFSINSNIIISIIRLIVPFLFFILQIILCYNFLFVLILIYFLLLPFIRVPCRLILVSSVICHKEFFFYFILPIVLWHLDVNFEVSFAVIPIYELLFEQYFILFISDLKFPNRWILIIQVF